MQSRNDVEEGDEDGMGHDLSQGRRHLQPCYQTDLDLPAYSGAVQTGISGKRIKSSFVCVYQDD